MKMRFSLLMVLALLFSLVPLTTFGQGGPAKKAAAQTSTALVIPPADGNWHTLMTTTIRNPTADDDLFIDVSLVNRLTTTVVDLSGPIHFSAATARLKLRVTVDSNVADPGEIVFDDQILALTQTLATAIATSCTTVTTNVVDIDCVCRRAIPPGTVIVGPSALCPAPPAALPPGTISRSCVTTTTPDTDQVCTIAPAGTPVWRLFLSEAIGHSFGFVAPGVGGSGETHEIKVQAKVENVAVGGGTAVQALLGQGSVTVEAVNLKP